MSPRVKGKRPAKRTAEQKREAARERARRYAAVFENGDAPPGWCEIQRDDEAVHADQPAGRYGTFDDEDAARLVCAAADVPGVCAALIGAKSQKAGSAGPATPICDPDSTDFDVRALGTKLSRAEIADGWIVCVPASVAFLAGLIDEADLGRHTRSWT